MAQGETELFTAVRQSLLSYGRIDFYSEPYDPLSDADGDPALAYDKLRVSQQAGRALVSNIYVFPKFAGIEYAQLDQLAEDVADVIVDDDVVTYYEIAVKKVEISGARITVPRIHISENLFEMAWDVKYDKLPEPFTALPRTTGRDSAWVAHNIVIGVYPVDHFAHWHLDKQTHAIAPTSGLAENT